MIYPTKKLGEVCEIITDGTHKTPKYQSEGVPFISTVNLIPFSNNFDFSKYRKFVSADEHLELIKRVRPQKNDVLLSKCGTIGRTQLVRVNYDFDIFVGLMLVRTKLDRLLPEFLEIFLNRNSVQRKLQSLSQGATMPTLPIRAFSNFQIPLPPLAIQKQIVERMDKIAGAQKLNDELIQKANELFQSLLHQELNPAGPADAKAMAGKKNWEVKKLGEVAQVKGGKRIPKGMNFSSERTSHPYLRVVDFMDGSIRIENLKYISDGIFKFIRNYTISPKDIYISIAGTIGLVGKIPEVLDGASLTENAAKILVDENKIDQDYLAFTLTTIQSKKQIKKFTQAVGVPKLALERIKKIQIFIPPLEIQKQIVAKLSAVQEYKKQLIEQKAKLKELFDSVLHKSMKG